MTERAPLGLFQGYGIEIEYMIVDAETLNVRPITDELLRAVSGSFESEIELGEIGVGPDEQVGTPVALDRRRRDDTAKLRDRRLESVRRRCSGGPEQVLQHVDAHRSGRRSSQRRERPSLLHAARCHIPAVAGDDP